MRAVQKTITQSHYRRRRSDREPVSRLIDSLLQTQRRRNRRIAVALSVATLLLVFNTITVVSLI